jgi:hypothetical protein
MAFKRPTQAFCANCGEPFAVNPVGRIPRFCRPGMQGDGLR